MKALISFVFIGFITLLLGFCSVEVIEPGNVGVKVNLGKVQNGHVGEGLQMKNPFTEEFRTVNVRQFTVPIESVCPSLDSQLVTTHYSVYARVNPEHANEVINKYANDGVESLFKSLVGPVAEGGIKPIIVKYRAEEALQKRDEVRALFLERLLKDVNKLFIIEDVQIGNIQLSPELREAIEKKQVREQEALAKKYDLERATKEAEITITNAKAEAEAIRLKGAAIRENPSVVQLDIVKAWAAGAKTPNTVVVGAGQGGANILLPIEK